MDRCDFEQFADTVKRSEEWARLGIVSLADIQEREAQWLVPGLIPSSQVSVLGADGGTGKSSLWVDLAAAISTGRASVLDPPGTTRPAGSVMYFSGEDSSEVVLKKKFRLAGADMTNIVTLIGSVQTGVKIGTPAFDERICAVRPTLAILDPLQSFLGTNVDMSRRNQMRNTVDKLLPLAEKTGTTFLIIMHANKRGGASGRKRLADSSDLWDISRSVIMCGYTGNDTERYASHEKCNYGPLQDTILFTIDSNGLPRRTGTTTKKDRDFVAAEALSRGTQPQTKTEVCKSWIMDELEQGPVQAMALADRAAANNFSKKVLRSAKSELRQGGQITTYKDRDRWFIAIPPNEL